MFSHLLPITSLLSTLLLGLSAKRQTCFECSTYSWSLSMGAADQSTSLSRRTRAWTMPDNDCGMLRLGKFTSESTS